MGMVNWLQVYVDFHNNARGLRSEINKLEAKLEAAR